MLTADEIKKIPTNPDTGIAVAGKDTLLYVLGAPAEGGKENWLLVGGQRNSPLKRKADELDASCKSDNGWGATLPGKKTWSIAYDGLLVLNDKGLEILDAAYMNSIQVKVKIVYPDKTYRTGWVSVTEFDDDHAHDAVSTVSVTLSGVGAITELQPASTT